MENIHQIVVPVDFHQHTEKLVDFALKIAAKLEAKLTFLHVVEHIAVIAGYSDVYPATLTEIDEKILGYAEKKMTALVEKSKVGWPDCQGAVLRGDVADRIVEYVLEKESDLIVMGTHGAKGIEKIMLGSVAERVLKSASCPILVFNPYKGERGYRIKTPINETLPPI